ncbi:DEAD/DEAH box helicase, partial [Burkholderia sp. SIMBA_057]
MKMGVIYGGEGYEGQKEQLAAQPDILVGTTGRLIDFYKQDLFSLKDIEVVVLDEADRMFDLG